MSGMWQISALPEAPDRFVRSDVSRSSAVISVVRDGGSLTVEARVRRRLVARESSDESSLVPTMERLFRIAVATFIENERAA